jgi:dimethylglycine dehydrogenase
MGVLVLAGPKSRDVLQKLTDTDLSNDNFKWLTGKSINVGIAQAYALRVNFVGELGWELHHPMEMQNVIFDLLMEAGREHGIKPFGIRAMGTMAVEKSYRLIGRELSVEYSAYESGLDRFVHPNKGDFIGRDELVKRHAAGDDWTFVTMEVHGIKDCDARGSEAIYAADGKTLVGRVTTGSYGWRVGQIAGAGHGQAGAGWRRQQVQDQDPRRTVRRDHHSRKPVRSGQRAPAGMMAFTCT